jgi:hypothetical protein
MRFTSIILAILVGVVAACLVGCMGTADDGGEDDLDSATTEASYLERCSEIGGLS